MNEEKENNTNQETLNKRTRWSRFETFGIVSLASAVISLSMSFSGFIPLYGMYFAVIAFILSVVGLVFGTISYKKNDGPRLRPLKKAGFIVSIIALVFAIIMFFVSLIFFIALISGQMGSDFVQ